MLDSADNSSSSALSRVKELQEEIARLSAQARDEALAQANAAVRTLKALGFSYQLIDGSGTADPRRRKQKALDCRVCGFATDPPHNARKHKFQGEAPQPFTEVELLEFGLRRNA